MRAVGEAFGRLPVQESSDTIPTFRALVRVYAVGIRTTHRRVDSELALTPYSIAPAHVSTGPLIASEAGSLPEGTGVAVDAARFCDACRCCSIGRHGSGEQRGLIGDLGRAT
ncbi:hypothetical protein OH799_02245 [Nocardia sp. NBC_00881]|uniref:hypothetical protein n=1 Tax=Nocardia sp. NBC_00881 TaxID=2975995 RepID=UPI00386E758C|nr:hypothetical protein OH799_02245 [Nocardia sp. NBC_00881]